MCITCNGCILDLDPCLSFQKGNCCSVSDFVQSLFISCFGFRPGFSKIFQLMFQILICLCMFVCLLYPLFLFIYLGVFLHVRNKVQSKSNPSVLSSFYPGLRASSFYCLNSIYV